MMHNVREYVDSEPFHYFCFHCSSECRRELKGLGLENEISQVFGKCFAVGGGHFGKIRQR